MNLRVFFNLLVLGSLLLALAGCASSPRSGQGAETEDATVGDAAVPDPNMPHLFFSGGDVQQVRGAALGAAVTQGWKVEETAGESLILRRNLDSTAAEALAPGASRGPLPPIVEVRADFFPRPGGVETQLGAQVITQRGTPKETRQDYTDAYRNELSHSLATLQNAWHEAGPRIAKALPPTGGFQDSRNTEGQVADNPAPSTFDGDYADNSFTDRNDLEPLTSSSAAAAEFETGNGNGIAGEPQVSSAATWALPAGAAAAAAAAAQARASALPPAPAQAATAKAGPAPVVSLAPAANPRLSQRAAPAPLPRSAAPAPQQVTTKGASGTSSAARGDQRVLISMPTGKAGKSEATSPAKATPTTTRTKMTSGSTGSTRSTATTATAAKPATWTTAPATTGLGANKKAPSAANKTTAPKSGAQTKAPTTKTAGATATKAAKPNATPASSSTAGQAPAKTTPVKQQPAKPAATGTKTASASGTAAASTNSTKTAANASKTNSANKTTGTTTGAKKSTSPKEN